MLNFVADPEKAVKQQLTKYPNACFRILYHANTDLMELMLCEKIGTKFISHIYVHPSLEECFAHFLDDDKDFAAARAIAIEELKQSGS